MLKVRMKDSVSNITYVKVRSSCLAGKTPELHVLDGAVPELYNIWPESPSTLRISFVPLCSQPRAQNVSGLNGAARSHTDGVHRDYLCP